MTLEIRSIPNTHVLPNVAIRKPKGCCISPYSFFATLRYILNYITNGWFSYRNPDRNKMKLLAKEGKIKIKTAQDAVFTSVKVAFLGDIMVSKSGKPPKIDEKLRKLLGEADIIVANLESPLVESECDVGDKRRSCTSLKFEMHNSYIEALYACNEKAKWVFNIANNHTCDTSKKCHKDIEGVVATGKIIRATIPSAEVIGAQIDPANSVLSLQVNECAKIGIVGWTEVKNNDRKHYRKEVIRESDLSEEVVAQIKREHDVLIAFPHGNEEQSYYPLKKVRDRWVKMMGDRGFDLVVGHGPHVLQPAEQIGNGLLFHSIGNFCSPIGKSQTKVGCVPTVDLCFSGNKLCEMNYRVNIIEQKDEMVHFTDNYGEKTAFYPDIFRRLKRIWSNLVK